MLGDVCLSFDGLPFPRFTTHTPSILALEKALSVHLHVQIINIVPDDLQATLAIIDLNREPYIATLPERVHVPLQDW